MIEAGLPDYAHRVLVRLLRARGHAARDREEALRGEHPAGQRPEVKAALAREGTEVALSKSPEDFAAFLAEDAKFWVRLAKDSGATAD